MCVPRSTTSSLHSPHSNQPRKTLTAFSPLVLAPTPTHAKYSTHRTHHHDLQSVRAPGANMTVKQAYTPFRIPDSCPSFWSTLSTRTRTRTHTVCPPTYLTCSPCHGHTDTDTRPSTSQKSQPNPTQPNPCYPSPVCRCGTFSEL